MDTAVSVATSLVGKVLNKLSDELVAAYVASSELGLNSDSIKKDLMYTQGLLHEAQKRGISDNPGLQGLLEELTTKANEAEDALDELHYFIIQDQLDGTQYTVPDLGDGLRGHASHGRHALRHIVGKCLKYFSYSPMQDEDRAAVTNISHNTTKPDSDGPVDKLPFDRVVMSKKIKSVIEEIHSLCEPASKLLNIIPHHSSSTTVTLNRPLIGSTIVQDKLYGRSVIFEQTIKDITCGTYHGETLSVLPIVGPGGIGKTTFTQHLYNDTTIKEHFAIRVWVCVSTDFDVFKLTQQIHNCIPATEKEESNLTNGTSNLDQLQISIAHRLKSKRFLIVLDDIWKCDSDVEWKTLLAPFTKGEAKGSMILVTTRFPKIEARVKKATIPINLQGLDPKEFLEFFQACVFGESKPDQQYNELIDIGREIAEKFGREIAEKLKCSPLAAKTVAPLLKKHLSWEHWRNVLENNEWKNQARNDDIMPALKISYDYLPFYLKQCFSYVSLFPEDHRFNLSQTTRFWTAIGIIDSSCKNKNYLEELVDNGFLMKEVDYLGDQCYVMHDLLHELSRMVSSQECVNISSLSFRADAIPQSVQHLSVTIEDRFDENFRKEMAKLKSWINIGNLRTLMIFREYEERFAEILKDTFEEIEGLRVLFIGMTSLESLPKNFSKLLHLRYLKLGSPYGLEISLPSTLPRFYHLMFLDLEDWCGSPNLPKYISRLISLRHFLARRELHSNIPEVGRMKCLQELKKFEVKKESVGFELSELGNLTDLGEKLGIYNLEKVATKKGAIEAKLVSKKDLKKLKLVWGTNQHTTESDVIDGLEPHPNLQTLDIINHGGTAGPSWLCDDISMKMLQSVYLDGVSWATLPPFGQLLHLTSLTLKNIYRVRQISPCFGDATEKSFMQLKRIVLYDLPELVEWVEAPNAHSFSRLEHISCSKCPKLCELPFLECSRSYTHLSELEVEDCPKLSMPPMPHTAALTRVRVSCDGLGYMIYHGNNLKLRRYSGALAFHNMNKLESITSEGESNIPWTELQNFMQLKRIVLDTLPELVKWVGAPDAHSFSRLEHISCRNCPKLCELLFLECSHLSELVIVGCPKLSMPPMPHTATLTRVEVSCDGLGYMSYKRNSLILRRYSGALAFHNMDKLEHITSQGESNIPWTELGNLTSSLRLLDISGDPSMQSMAPLSNLTSLTRLRVVDCENLRVDGFNHLITAVNLKQLTVYNRGNSPRRSVAADLLSEMAISADTSAAASSFQLQLEELAVDSISAVLVAPICTLLAPTLKVLRFWYDHRLVESLREEEEKALQLLTSLQSLGFYNCPALPSLPQGLHSPPSLTQLWVWYCPGIRSLPKGGLPTSLRYLSLHGCSAELKEEAEKLKGTNPDLVVIQCMW